MRPGSCFPELPIKPLTRGLPQRTDQPNQAAFDPSPERQSGQGLGRVRWPRRDKPGTELFKDRASARPPARIVLAGCRIEAVRCLFMCMESEPPDDCDLAERQYSDRLRSHEKFCVTSLLGDTPSPITSGLMPSVVKAVVAAFFVWWPTYTPDGAFYTRRIPPWWF